MVSRLSSATVVGVDGVEVQVEVDLRPSAERHTYIVGLPDTAVKESSQRVESAITNSGLVPPMGGIFVVNLAPADLKKQGPGFDLPIALGMVACLKGVSLQADEWCLIGELALDGGLRPVQGILPQAIEARAKGKKKFMVPADNAPEAAAVGGTEVYPVSTLAQAWALIAGEAVAVPYVAPVRKPDERRDQIDYADVKGQSYARRAIEIAAAGGHNILMSGSPGSGKSMLAQRLTTILPLLSEEESIETSKIHSVCGLLPRDAGLVSERPLRSPHHTISDAGLMGGGASISPGEVSLAHHGVLFLDELPEFRRVTLETLRQPLETGQVVISRASGTMTFPCRFMLVAAMNLCPCGYLGDPRRNCCCSPAQIAKYRAKISGPLLDRFDLMIEVGAVDTRSLVSGADGEPSSAMRERVLAARNVQKARYGGTQIPDNAGLTGRRLKTHCALGSHSAALLHEAIDQLALSARAHDRILRVARTIADLAAEEHIAEAHLYEAIQFRSFENRLR